jgi:gamma-glutamyltranspeptidase/glutathione hydrolase
MSGAVAAGHPSTAAAGARILAGGGNAVDACVAAALAAFVVEGPLTGPAGGGFLLYHGADGGPTVVYDCFFAVPAVALGEMEETVVDFADASTQTFHVGLGSVAVPGLLHGLEAAHREHGRLPWRSLAAPALELAAAGAPVGEVQEFLHEILAAILLREEGGRRIYGTKGRVETADLVPTLEAIRDLGARAVAGILPELAGDLDRYEVAVAQPCRTSFGATEIAACPAPSRGGAVVVEALDAISRQGMLGSPGSGEDAVQVARALAAGYARATTMGRPTGTTQISVVDADRNAVGLSSTLGSGSGVFRGGCQLNNMLGELDVIGYEERAAGSRLPSMMTPTVVLDDGRPRLVVGSAGSVRLAGAIVQVISTCVGHGIPVDEAIARPRLHPEGRRLHVEGGVGEKAVAALEADGWEVVRWAGRNLFFGGVAAVELRPDGTLAAAGDPRRGGAGVVAR